MGELDDELAEGVAALRAARDFLKMQFIVESCAEGEPVEGCLSCMSIAAHDAMMAIEREIDAALTPAPPER